MAICNIHSTSVHVSNQDKAVDFFVNKLGFEKHADEPFTPEGHRWIEVAPPGAETVLILVHGFNAWMPELIGKFTNIVFSTDDVESTYRELSDRGVEFTDKPSVQPWGMFATFVDPDRNSYLLSGPAPAGQEPQA